jgi:hypothetical protein
MNLRKIISAHSGEDKKVLIVILLAYTNLHTKLIKYGCASLGKLDRQYMAICKEYEAALIGHPFNMTCIDLEEISADPYGYLFTIKAEFIKEFGDI